MYRSKINIHFYRHSFFVTFFINVLIQHFIIVYIYISSWFSNFSQGSEISFSPVITSVTCTTDVTDFDSCTYQIGSCSSTTNIVGVTCTQSNSIR